MVVALTSYSTSDLALAQLLRCLFFIKALYDFERKVVHLENAAADALSHKSVIDFFALLPQATLDPSPISPDLIKLVTNTSLKWTSRASLQNFLQGVLMPEPIIYMPQCSGAT